MATVVARGGGSRASGRGTALRVGARRTAALVQGAALGASGLLLLLAVASYRPGDPSLNTASGAAVRNWAGAPGAWAGDLLLSLAGPAAVALPLALLLLGARVARFAGAGRWRRQLGAALGASGLLATALALLQAQAWQRRAMTLDALLAIGAGVLVPATLLIVGVAIATRLRAEAEVGRKLLLAMLGVVLLAAAGVALSAFGDLDAAGLPAGWGGVLGWAAASALGALSRLVPDPLLARAAAVALAMAAGLGGLALLTRALRLRADERAWLERMHLPRLPARLAPATDEDNDAPHAPDDADDVPTPFPLAPERERGAGGRAPVISERAPPRAAADRRPRERASTTAPAEGAYQLPELGLLEPPPPASAAAAIDKAALERNARLLETVLDDFSVKGEIVEVRPGPVVTMYELEPASGIKASRVIALADDIARNMQALSARVATIPGRSVIGIELPNAKRETVSLSELLGSNAFEDGTASLPLILGKNIAGEPIVADLSPMPHLLVAGTTGSGKSVGLNAMILSLLYRLTPEQCRMIMIDPKMLELSVYDDIPHLLSPVVTEPGKAVRALKWTVEQMEERYRMMASVGVRGLASFNAKVREAKAKGQPLGRRVQTGYHPDTGQPQYEEEQLEFDTLPQIVVVVDELADLMMTAGKEVEFLIQRLAQKARAAGIHLIMATQRPSVDVITGVIKANLPTRISFQVTSKIDSRTILGEQGAEQLLGKGDMLYMPGGKQIIRVHGPFVSDDEVRAVADHWRGQGVPDYIQAVTEEPEDGGYVFEGQPSGDDDPETALYRRAIQVVAESGKASTSYVQRQLRIGYNSAARLIERMEKEGKVSAPDHVGRREVLVDPEGHAI